MRRENCLTFATTLDGFLSVRRSSGSHSHSVCAEGNGLRLAAVKADGAGDGAGSGDGAGEGFGAGEGAGNGDDSGKSGDGEGDGVRRGTGHGFLFGAGRGNNGNRFGAAR